MADVRDSMGLPNGGTTASVTKATAAFEKWQATLKKAADEMTRMAKAAGTLPGASGGGGAGNLTTSGSFTNQGSNPNGGMGSMGGFGSTVANVARLGVQVAGAAYSMMPTVQQAVSTQFALSQAQFYGYQGGASGINALMRTGTANSPDDALKAIAFGQQNGLSSGLPGFSSLLGGVGQVSNVTGSFQSAMSATAGLNQATTVNQLRTFGISVRGANGAMRSPSAIFKDIYDFASRAAGHKLSKRDIALGMQSGNGMSNLIQAVAGGNSDLAVALQGSANQFATGGDLSRGSTTGTGLTTAASNATSNYNASEFNKTAAASNAMASGYTEATNIQTKVNDKLASIVSSNKGVAAALKQGAKAETLMASSLGAAAAAIAASIGQFVAAVSAASLGGGGMGGAGMLGRGGAAAAGSVLLKGSALLASGWAAGKAQNFLDQKYGDKVSPGVRTAGNIAADMGKYALYGAGIGTLIPIPGISTGVGAAIGAGYGLLHGLMNSGGSGLGLGASASSSSAGSANLTAGMSAVSLASTQLGVPYSWGGGSTQGPTIGINQGSKTVGFDCSALTRFVMGKLGIVLPRTAHDQQKMGTAVDPTKAQPGDLLFWGYPAHHVAIYAGNGMMIQAPQTGGHVEKVSVNLKNVTSCRRVINSKTGSVDTGNLLNYAKQGESTNWGLTSSGGAGGPGAGSVVSSEYLMGVNPAQAMGGSGVGGSGLGLGAADGYSASSSALTIRALHGASMVLNSKTGSLDHVNASGTTIHYGGVTIPITIKDSMSPKDVAAAIKEQLVSLSIDAKVATS